MSGEGTVPMPAGDGAAKIELVYVAYPSSLLLRSANAVQTYNTIRELRAQVPALVVLLPRWARRQSVFGEVGARHLLRLPFNVLSHLWRTTVWSYLERSWFAWRVAVYLLRRRTARARVIYVRDAVIAAWFGLGLARLVGAPYIYEIHDLEQWNPSRARSPLARPFVRLLDAVAIRRAAAIVTLTAEFRAYLARVGLRAAGEVAVIPDAYDDARYFPRAREEARAALGLSPTATATVYVVTYAGLTWAYRGLEGLVRAFAALRRDHPASLLLLVGGRDSERAALAALGREFGLGEALVMPGQRAQDDVPRYLAASDLLVVPGLVSGLNASPLKLFEYAAMARPIVAVDTPALREVLGDDGARYYPAGDEAALLDALRALCQDSVAASALADAARRRVAPYTYRARAAAIVAWAARAIR